MAAHGAKSRIEEDMEQAAALGARGTPNLFINGRKLVGAKDEAVLKALIDEELAKAEALVKGGTAPGQVYETIISKGKLLDSLAPEAKELALPKTVATRGPVGAAVHIVTFQDFQCPFSARLDPHLRALEAEMPGRIKVTWVDFPMDKIHPLAQTFAQAGQEALAQGKFWEFHKAVTEGGDQRDEAILRQRAKQAGLDLKKLEAALKDQRHAAAVAAGAALGQSLEVKGTPTVYLNGHLFMPQNGFSTATFRTAVTRLLGGK
jgi:protein-disulfide isomerase